MSIDPNDRTFDNGSFCNTLPGQDISKIFNEKISYILPNSRSSFLSIEQDIEIFDREDMLRQFRENESEKKPGQAYDVLKYLSVNEVNLKKKPEVLKTRPNQD